MQNLKYTLHEAGINFSQVSKSSTIFLVNLILFQRLTRSMPKTLSGDFPAREPVAV